MCAVSPETLQNHSTHYIILSLVTSVLKTSLGGHAGPPMRIHRCFQNPQCLTLLARLGLVALLLL